MISNKLNILYNDDCLLFTERLDIVSLLRKVQPGFIPHDIPLTKVVEVVEG